MNKLSIFNSKNFTASKLANLKPGWTVRIHQKIKDGEKTRTQAFEGLVIAKKHGQEAGGTVTVRKVSGGIGVEKIFPLYLPSIDKVEVVKRAKVRRAKLYYLKDKSSKEIRRKTKTLSNSKDKDPSEVAQSVE
ncbi:MAG: 50S ribosomal protein L19 [Candidatus Yanofskybacteria bacterium RIFCSPHIGHO2_01_FULL_41_27]|uniref:50S ribosomal protein L19 n=3 Tax=Parcubacteria group TaxID=1794811 RepID=A0A1F8HUI9_9BACT|nr:MAG: 50S ribosomal protein L19 [Candidatus Jorgensenbacteria bacterium GW2011_GWF2_41_8]OGM99600.1 MAG: 50S ribosomal protein L19 [Candidatus Yanofskybacteria bacterium RIFCSPHIGHO2_01_FULL_41_27]OGN20078.1 MAG: 50S ribosomal protein L19 [Candidatus Yanofskybacteria bacterium RIFCSPLOWO2_01_FULL_41_33]OGN41264.1 MAG: 50S ribosomal protein L19 [Candidatus Yanofskybacteria bacterium RIFOXYD1_FULL_42_10]